MRHMSEFLSGNPTNTPGMDAPAITIPRIPANEWNAKLTEIAGRELNAAEWDRVAEMSRHNWTLRVIASELFGEAHVDAFFAPKS
jgi:hypothetical protein